jgi:hypothetical protein
LLWDKSQLRRARADEHDGPERSKAGMVNYHRDIANFSISASHT